MTAPTNPPTQAEVQAAFRAYLRAQDEAAKITHPHGIADAEIGAQKAFDRYLALMHAEAAGRNEAAKERE